MISENKKCLCCKSCKDCPGFHKIANLKNIGLLIYQYSVHDKDVKNKQECLQKPSGIKSDVIIVHNKTNVDISADKYLLEIDKYTSCPRCKYKFEHAKKLLAKIPRIEKLDTVTICNHCRAKVKKPCQVCSEIVNTFITSKIQKKKLLKEVLLWLSNVENILEKNEKLSHLHRCTGSQLNIDSLRHVSSSLNSCHQPQIGQLLEFEASTQLTLHPTKIQFSKKTEIIKGPLVTKSESALLYVHDEKIKYNNKITPLTFYHSYEHLGQPKSIPKPIQQTIELEEETYASKNLKLQDSLKKGARRDQFKINEHIYDDRNFINKTYKDERPGILLQQTELKSILSKTSLRKGTIHMSLSAQHSEESLGKDFSYFFIKETSKDIRPITKRKSSAELIRDIQDKLETKLELEKKEKEEKNLEKIEEGEKRRLLKTELEMKKLQQLESEKNKKDEKRSSDEELKDGKKIKKKIEAVPLIPKPSVKDVNDKNKKKLTDIPKVKESLRIQKEKTEKEGKMQADKDRKLKEKPVKEDKMQAEKERKLKEKEERENLKKEKEESLRKEKEEKRKYEEELRKKKDEEKSDKRQSDKNDAYAKELKRMLAEQAKQKEKESKIKSQQEEPKKKIAVENKPSEDNQGAETKTTKEPPPEKKESKSQKGVTEPKSKGIINQIKVRTPSPDDLILQLVKLKQSDPDREKKPRPKRLSQLNIPSETITAHKGHKNKKEPECIICNDSELEIDIENIVLNNLKSEKINDIIVGENILKCKSHIQKEVEEIEIAPLFFKSTFKDDGIANVPKQDIPEYVTETKESKPYPVFSSKYAIVTKDIEPR